MALHCHLFRSCEDKCTGNADNGVGGKPACGSPCWWKMDSSQLHCLAEDSHHCHISRALQTSCSAVESSSYTAAEADDVLPDICHSTGLLVFVL